MTGIASCVRFEGEELAHSKYDGIVWSVFSREEGQKDEFALLETDSRSGKDLTAWVLSRPELLGMLFRRLPGPAFAEIAWALVGKIF